VKILLVDENDMNRDMLSRRLIRRGYDVMTAIDGASALSLASTQGPDVVLMDMSMPVMDGWETTRRMKADAGTASIRIIALTAHAMAADRARALAAGCDDFDTKPVDLDRLIAKIDAVTAGRSA
jgi:CheY-like chemotaxis protein